MRPHSRWASVCTCNYCTTCHGSDARGARGYPNLRDGDWIWGGTPESIKTTITNGRQAAMPAWEGALGGERGVDEVAQYVLSLSGRATISELADKGKAKYEIFCVACHGADGTGNTALGAPNLTDDTWLYGGSLTRISESIAKGRNGKCRHRANSSAKPRCTCCRLMFTACRNSSSGFADP